MKRAWVMLNKFKAWVLYSKSFIFIILVIIMTFIVSWLLTFYLKAEGKRKSLDLSATMGSYSCSLDYEAKLNMVLVQEKNFTVP